MKSFLKITPMKVLAIVGAVILIPILWALIGMRGIGNPLPNISVELVESLFLITAVYLVASATVTFLTRDRTAAPKSKTPFWIGGILLSPFLFYWFTWSVWLPYGFGAPFGDVAKAFGSWLLVAVVMIYLSGSFMQWIHQKVRTMSRS